jgi:hypothetical protein
LVDEKREQVAVEPLEPVVVAESGYGIQYLTLHGADIQPSPEDSDRRQFVRYAVGSTTAMDTVGGYYASVHLPDNARILEFSIWYEGTVKAYFYAQRLAGGWDGIAEAGSEDTPRATMGLVGPIPVSHRVNNAGYFYFVQMLCRGTDWNKINAVQIKYELPLP